MNDIFPKKTLAFLSLLTVNISVGAIVFMIIEITTSLFIYKFFILSSLVIIPFLGGIMYRKKVVKSIIDIWDEVPTILHIGIILSYASLMFGMFFKVLFPYKESEYESKN